MEYALTPNWSLRAEYRYSDYGTLAPFSGQDVGTTSHTRENTVTAGFSYLFTTPLAPVVAKY